MTHRPPTGFSRGYFGLGLWRPGNACNVGHILRAAGCYGAAFVAIAEKAGANILDSKTDTQKAWRHIPLHRVDSLTFMTPLGCSTVAVEICPWAKPLPDFVHPERAFYLFGPEGGSLPENLIAAADHAVAIPTRRCMNLAAAAQVVLYDRLVKRRHVQAEEDAPVHTQRQEVPA